MSERRFIDANVFLRHLLRDDEEKADRVLALIERLDRGDELAVTNNVVISEIIFTLHRSYRFPKPQIREIILALLRTRGLRVPEREAIEAALQLYVDNNISYGDAYSSVWMRDRGITEIYSWDREFERVPWVNRREP